MMTWRSTCGEMRLAVPVAVLATLLINPGARSWQDIPGDGAPVIRAKTPASREDFLSLQMRIQGTAKKVIPAVVAIRGSAELPQDPDGAPGSGRTSGGGTGVIISPEGLILSQSHVTHGHPEPTAERKPPRGPGERLTVVLGDGRECEAELLGADQALDLSALRLIKPGPYPHVAMSDSARVARGEWVLKLGHPLGYRNDRPPVVRLGRVLYQSEHIFVTDCLVASGDSGGPFFDLDGRIVGIVASTMAPSQRARSLYCEDPGRFGPFSVTAAPLIAQYLDPMVGRRIAPYDRTFWLHYFGRYGTVPDAEILPRADWTHGEVASRALRQAIRVSGPAVVSILDEADHEVSLGTTVDADGWIMTPVSTLPATPRCRLPDSRVVPARVVGVSPAFDLALLRVTVDRLASPSWVKTPPVAGTILASIGPPGLPLAFGVVSVPECSPPGPFPARAEHLPGRLPPLTGEPTAEGLAVRGTGQLAAGAGIRVGDIIREVAGRPIGDAGDLVKCVADRGAGESVPVRLTRNRETMELRVELAGIRRPGSSRRFPAFFEHDTPIHRRQCGGPVVDLDGEFVGITVCPSEYGCMAIPATWIRRLLEELKTGGSTDRWDRPRVLR